MYASEKVSKQQRRVPQLVGIEGGKGEGAMEGRRGGGESQQSNRNRVSINIPPGLTGTPRDPPDAPGEPY